MKKMILILLLLIAGVVAAGELSNTGGGSGGVTVGGTFSGGTDRCVVYRDGSSTGCDAYLLWTTFPGFPDYPELHLKDSGAGFPSIKMFDSGTTSVAPIADGQVLTIQPATGALGGVQFAGSTGGNASAIVLKGFSLTSGALSEPAIKLDGLKSNGAGGYASLGATDELFEIRNNNSARLTMLGDGTITLNNGTGAGTGIVKAQLLSDASDPADTGDYMLGNAESICWEASPAGTDVCLSVDSSERLGVTGGTISAGFVWLRGIPNFNHGLLDPLDGTTYYINAIDIFPPTSNHIGTIMFAPAGTVVQVCVMGRANGTLGSDEDVTFTVRKNESDTSMTFTQDWNSSAFTNVSCATTNTFTTANNDRLSVKVVTPAWATNPTQVMTQWWAQIRLDQ